MEIVSSPPRAVQWLRRYAPAELAAVLGALTGASVVALWWPDGAASAIAGSLGEAVAFYGYLLVRDLRASSAQDSWPLRAVITVRELVIEFGPAELVDTIAVRPLAMYLGEVAMASTVKGVLVGKVAADLVFYGVAITGAELRRRLRVRTAPASAAMPSTGPSLAAPALAGPALAGPSLAGPSVAGPGPAGPALAGPVVVGGGVMAKPRVGERSAATATRRVHRHAGARPRSSRRGARWSRRR